MNAIHTQPTRMTRRGIAIERSRRLAHASRWTRAGRKPGATCSVGFIASVDRGERAP